MFYKDLIEDIKDLFLRYNGVRYCVYQDKMLMNAQGNNAPVQVFIDDATHSRLNRTESEFIIELNIVCLQQPTPERDILDVQDWCYALACNVIGAIDRQYSSVMQVWDYSIITISHVSDDDSSGVRITLELRVANPVDLCYEFNDEPYSGDTEFELSISGDTISGLDIKPVVLPRRKVGC